MNIIKIVLISLLPAMVWAQLPEDRKAIKGQCGCFDIEFKYAETFSPVKEYQFHDRYQASATEYVFVVEETNKKIVLQHLLAINDTMVVKHWREDWSFEDPDLLHYYKNKSWKYTAGTTNLVKNMWTQKVFEVDDGPRYQGRAEWLHGNGQHLWESTVDAPLPRREYTKRSDYNVLKRHNRLYVSAAGYLHEQDNDKILRTDVADSLIAQEKGYNTYKLTDAAKCEVAKKWWAENQAFWADVRAAWEEILQQKKDFGLKLKVDDESLHKHFKKLEDAGKGSAANRQAIREVLSKFVVFEEGY